MAQPATSIRHHIVPRFLLANFADPPVRTGRLFALDKTTGDVLASDPKNVTILKRYYVLPDDPEIPDDAPEDMPEKDLARIEQEAAPVIGRIVSGERMPEAFEEQGILALFVATLRARTPREREQFAAMSESYLMDAARKFGADREQIARFLLKTEGDASPEAVAEFEARIQQSMDSGDFKVKVPLDRSLGTLMRLAVEMSATIYADLAWIIVRAPEGASPLIISDCPVAMYDPTLTKHRERGNALRSSPEARMTVPLSPSTVLRFRPTDDVPGLVRHYREAEPGETDEINLRTYAWADRWIFGPAEDALKRVHQRAVDEPEQLHRVHPRPYFTPTDQAASPAAPSDDN